jgi:vacuolar-type H+-ATPase subunit E/Vma4
LEQDSIDRIRREAEEAAERTRDAADAYAANLRNVAEEVVMGRLADATAKADEIRRKAKQEAMAMVSEATRIRNEIIDELLDLLGDDDMQQQLQRMHAPPENGHGATRQPHG